MLWCVVLSNQFIYTRYNWCSSGIKLRYFFIRMWIFRGTFIILLYAYNSLWYYFTKKKAKTATGRQTLTRLYLLDHKASDKFQHGCRILYIERSLDEIIEDAEYYRNVGRTDRDGYVHLTTEEIESLKTILEPYHKSEDEIAESIYEIVMKDDLTQELDDELKSNVHKIIHSKKGRLRHHATMYDIAQDITQEINAKLGYSKRTAVAFEFFFTPLDRCFRGANYRDFYLKKIKITETIMNQFYKWHKNSKSLS